jgi:hypothetical protein
MAQFFVAAGTFALAIATYFLIPKKASLEKPFVRELTVRICLRDGSEYEFEI